MGNSHSVGAAAATLICGLGAYHFNVMHKRNGEAPMLWSWIPFLGEAIVFGQKPMEFMIEKAKTAGELFGVLLAGERVFFINDPSSYNLLFKVDKKKLSFDEFTHGIMLDVFGVSPAGVQVSIDQKLEDKGRAQYNKYLFQDAAADELTERMQKKMVEISKAELREKQVVDMRDFVFRMMYRASIASVFTPALADDEEIYQSFLAFDSKFALALAGVPYSVFPAASKGRADCVERMRKEVRSSSKFILERVAMYDESGIADIDAAKNQFAVCWASVGNSMPACYWVLYYILMHADATEAVRKELSEVFADRSPSVSLEVNGRDLPEMKVLDSCVSEALRLMSGSLIMRQVLSDDGCAIKLASGNSYTFRKGDKVGLFPALVHYDDDIYKNPSEFKYDRFLNAPSSFEKNGSSIPFNMCYLPFGAGSTWCPGRKFARNEVKTVIAYLFANFDMSFVDKTQAAGAAQDYDGSRAGIGIFPPRGTLQLNLSPRF